MKNNIITSPTRPVSRQRLWQRQMIAEGRCQLCAKKADGPFCRKHVRSQRIHARDRYRSRHGIPLDAPVAKRKRGKAAEAQRIHARNQYRKAHGIPLDAPVRVYRRGLF